MSTPNEAYWNAAQAGANPIAVGQPGSGKTKGVYAFAKATGRKVYTLIGSLRDPSDIGGCPFPAKKTYSSAIGPDGSVDVQRLIPPEWVTDCCYSGDKWIIFLDELTTCAPPVQAALLRVVAEKVVGDTPLPDDVWILGACNPPESAANGVDIEPPMANRLYHHKWELDTQLVLDGYAAGLDFGEPKFPVLPARWESGIPLVGKLVSEYHKRHPGQLLAFPEERAAQCGAWPSPRTWEYLIRCVAAAESVGADPLTRRELIVGLVGEGAGMGFCTYWDNLDLPDPEILLAEAIAAGKAGRPMQYAHPDRPDKVLAMLAALNQAVILKNTRERWLAAVAVLDEAGKHDFVAAFAGVQPLARACNGHGLPDGFVKRWGPKIQIALGG